MELAQIRQLIQYSAFPCVSVIVRTHTTHPENQKDDIKLRNEFKQVEERLIAEGVDKRLMGSIMHDLNFLADGIDHQHNSQGLILFVSENHKSCHRVGFPVEDRVVIDKTFATRDLVRQILEVQSYRVMTLSDKSIRLFKGFNKHLNEIRYNSFPADIHRLLSHHRGKGDEKEKRAEQLNQIDKDLQQILQPEPLPLVLMGTEQMIGAFKSVTDNPNHIYVDIHGNFDDTSKSELAEKALEALESQLEDLQKRHLGDLDKAIGQGGQHASGLQQVWRQAFQANGKKLLVENNYRQAGNVVGGIDGFELEYVEDSTAPGVIDDLVDEVIEEVLKYGGEVAFVPDGALKDHNSIALITRR